MVQPCKEIFPIFQRQCIQLCSCFPILDLQGKCLSPLLLPRSSAFLASLPLGSQHYSAFSNLRENNSTSRSECLSSYYPGSPGTLTGTGKLFVKCRLLILSSKSCFIKEYSALAAFLISSLIHSHTRISLSSLIKAFSFFCYHSEQLPTDSPQIILSFMTLIISYHIPRLNYTICIFNICFLSSLQIL